jgi:isopenicillin N synthase-like dioxygenase
LSKTEKIAINCCYEITYAFFLTVQSVNLLNQECSTICRILQVLNHGMPEEVIMNIKRDIHEFFKLPLEVKNAYAQRPGDLQGYGQAYVFSEDQKLDWADMFGIITQPPEARDMKLWPAQPLTFRSA